MTDQPEPITKPILPAPPSDGSYGYQTHVTITPAYAAKLIAANAANQRGKKPRKISLYSADMRNDLWRSDTGETIKVSTGGYLIDGQNRMHAVVASDKPQIFDIAWNVPADRIEVIDGGTPRSIADRFRIHQGSNPTVLGPFLRWAVAAQHSNIMLVSSGYQPTQMELQKAYVEDPALYDGAAARGKDLQNAIRGVNPGAAAMAYFLFSRADKVAANLFWDKLVTGENLAIGMPIYSLRERFIGPTARFLSRQEQLALICRAFNGWASGETLASIQLPRNGLTNESFPYPLINAYGQD